MSEQRRPAVFRLDDPHVAISDADAPLRSRGRSDIVIQPEPEAALPAEILAPPARKRFRWGTVFWSALGGLVSMGASLAVWKLVEDLFARNEWLGWIGLALAVVAAFALLVIVVRESIGLMRLAAVETLRERAVAILASDDRDAGRTLIGDLIAFARKVPRLARGRVALEAHSQDIIDGADLVRLAERELLPDLDAEARQLVADASKRVSVVTAVSPRAAVDMLFVLYTAVRLIRRLAELYGGRPGWLGMIRLVRGTITHLAVTGGMAAGDSIVQQMLGHGVAAKLSAKLGEGVLNGLLTARLGLAAIDVVRPLPFTALSRPTMTDVASGFVRRKEAKEDDS
jgi:putative membrane protein